MKTLKNLFAIAILSVIALGVNAQNESATVAASATVTTQLTITKNVDMNFGNISGTTDGPVKIDPKGSAHGYVGATVAVGKLTISAANSTSIKVIWPATIDLSNGTPADDMTLTLDVNGYTTDVPASSTDLTTPADVTTSGSGAYFIYVGGSLGALSSQTAGTYTGSALFEVEYN